MINAKTRPALCFYLPSHRRPSGLSEDVGVDNIGSTKSMSFWNSPLAWTLQTYLRLREQGYPCKLVDSMPDEGIVVVHRGDLPFNTKPSAKQLFVVTLGDAGWHPYAQVQIVQNPNQLYGVENTHLMQHWTQPGLVPRSQERGDRLEHVAFFGHPDQLADKLKSPEWQRLLQRLNLRWIPVHKGSDRQSDYSDIDLIVGIRSFDGRPYHHKPATKLHNAWLAGVPAILGPESSYQAERTHPLDYLEASSFEQLCEQVTRLSENADLRCALRERSEHNRTRIDPKQKAHDWWHLLTGPVADVYFEWLSLSRVQQQLFFARRWGVVKKNSLHERISSIPKLMFP